MKKTILLIFLSICISSILGGCGKSELPDTSSIRINLDHYYSQRLCQIESIEIDKETINTNEQEALRICTIIATAIDGSFRTTDSWEAYYIHHDKEGWELFDTTYVSSDCKLLTDISENECSELLRGILPEGTQIDSIVSDRDNYTARATYTYNIKDDIFEGSGTLTTNITGTANFSWDMLRRWTLESTEESKEYIYNAAFNLQVESGSSTLNSEKFWLSMDVKINDNIPSLEIVNYQGSVDTIGNLSISNVQLEKDEDNPGTVEITFDFMRDIENIENDKNYSEIYAQYYYSAEGNGSIVIPNEGSTRVYFYNWVFNGWGGNWKNYIGYASRR